MKKISVIVCTLERPESLANTLQSIDPPRQAELASEIIVVDNGSSDRTLQVVTRLATQSRIPIQWVREPLPGLSRARNRGVGVSSGDLLAFIDDDARAEPGWLDALLLAFAICPAASAAGGPIVADGVRSLPEWLPPRLRSHLSILDYGPRPKSLTYPYYPFGTNMAVKRSALDRVGGFDTDLGRKGAGCLMTGEETDLFLRIEKDGGTIRYQPSAVVRHTIDSHRLNPRWIYSQTLRIGFSSALMEKKSKHRLYCFVHLLDAMARVAAAAAAWPIAACSGSPRTSVLTRSIMFNSVGYLRGFLTPRGVAVGKKFK